jgi:hypothetical protein
LFLWIATLPLGVRDDVRGCILSMGNYLLLEKRLLNALKEVLTAIKRNADQLSTLVGGEGDDGVREDAKLNGSDESNNHYEECHGCQGYLELSCGFLHVHEDDYF